MPYVVRVAVKFSYHGFVPGFASVRKPGYETLVRKSFAVRGAVMNYICIHIRVPGTKGLRGACGCNESFVPGFRTRVCIRTQTRVRNPGTRVFRGACGCNESYAYT